METKRSMTDPMPKNPQWGDLWVNPITKDMYRYTDGEWLHVYTGKAYCEYSEKNIELQHCFNSTYKDKNGWMYMQTETNGPLYLCKAAMKLTPIEKLFKLLKITRR